MSFTNLLKYCILHLQVMITLWFYLYNAALTIKEAPQDKAVG